MIRFRCPGPCSCGVTVTVPDSQAGCRIPCPNSAALINVPPMMMGEEQWLTSSQPQQMLQHLPVPISTRKQHLFGVACCRRIEDILDMISVSSVIDLVERAAEGQASEAQLSAQAHRLLERMRQIHIEADYNWAATRVTHLNAAYWLANRVWPARAAQEAAFAMGETFSRRYEHEEEAAQADLLRDLVGNPFRPVSFDPTWRAPVVLAMAEEIYAERRFGDMPILADALEEAGCEQMPILEHCRQTQEHVRGCWVLDGLLGKE